MDKSIKKLLAEHKNLVHSEKRKVTSHVQRRDGEWYVNTLMTEGCDAPFKYRRQKQYKSLNGKYVNLTYYPASENVAGFEIEIMKVVRVRIS
ncbi:MAG: hypothetical protein GXP10_04770 [Gammaproteobacteria bacterium]|nr:hypothetical protein [Gammaproteobacteria bacterium]